MSSDEHARDVEGSDLFLFVCLGKEKGKKDEVEKQPPPRALSRRGNTALGWPTATTIGHWKRIVTVLGKYPWVWFGIVNEPQSNWDGALDSLVCWSATQHTPTLPRLQCDPARPPNPLSALPPLSPCRSGRQ